MKKVRFETPVIAMDSMQNYECHSPRPFIERQVVNFACDVARPRPLVFSNDPIKQFENSDSSPYPAANKTYLNTFPKLQDRSIPSRDLDLSLLDFSQPACKSSVSKINSDFVVRTELNSPQSTISSSRTQQVQTPHRVLTSIENMPKLNPPNILSRDNDFFLRRDNLGKLSFDHLSPGFNRLTLSSEKVPVVKKNELIRVGAGNTLSEKENYTPKNVEFDGDCRCHHCVKLTTHADHSIVMEMRGNVQQPYRHLPRSNYNLHTCVTPPHMCSCNCNMQIVQPPCHCRVPKSPESPQNAVDKKTWAIEKYEKSQKSETMEVEKQSNVSKEKREPTVADLFKIIKLHNEQLQLLQDKVDKFISAHNQEKQLPIQNYVTEQMAVQTVNSEQHKISIGVMTSFEMVRTSTVINKEVLKQCEAQIQCNRSQISIKEVVAKKQAGNLNFLDGIPPVSKNVEMGEVNDDQPLAQHFLNNFQEYETENVVEDKTLNEMSLYNVQVDNATTPMMSPDQSLYLDIRDYSESDSGSEDQSNVGWTYYNKVMTHVNGLLQDSDMPSSASALYRQTKQKCMQMQIDKSNVSAAKRVTFGDAPLGIQQQHIATPTDTSLKMNQLAAKYLKNTTTSNTGSPKTTEEMSFATRNYMQKHKLLQGEKLGQNTPLQEIPRFLDITALKQQPKLI